jgi:hypothetical protein
MLKSWLRDIALAAQVRSGASPGAAVWIAIGAVASLTAFIFLCVAAFDWLALQTTGIVAGLTMAGIFALIALVAIVACTLTRRRVRERAMLERTARAHAPSWLSDPRILAAAVQIGRDIGWQRIVPLALVGFMAAQWARDHREQTRASD